MKRPKVFEIRRIDGKRFIRCECCQQLVGGSLVTHLKREHREVWKEYVAAFVELRRQGYSYKKIMWHFGRAFSWTVVERALAEAGVPPRQRVPRLPLEPEEFRLEETTVWSFPNRGRWAVHDSSYRGNWAPEVPRNLILRYTEPGDWVLDPFVGGGTTAIEALLLGRNVVGLDINPAAVSVSRRKIRKLKARLRRERGLGSGSVPMVRILRGDARCMTRVPSESVDLVCAHPPYLDIVEYTRTNPADLSTITDPDRYVREMRKVGLEMFRCLRPGGVIGLLIGDVRREGKLIPLGTRVLHALLDMFQLQEIVIKTQHNAAGSRFYEKGGYSFLRIVHEYLFIMRKAGGV